MLDGQLAVKVSSSCGYFCHCSPTVDSEDSQVERNVLWSFASEFNLDKERVWQTEARTYQNTPLVYGVSRLFGTLDISSTQTGI